MPDPPGRFSIAFDDPTVTWDATWTHLDQEHPNLITSYTIDRGRQFELDRTDGGRATVEVLDPDGVLDPANPSSPYVGKLEPLLQARLGRRNPVTGEWFTRFRGFIEEFDYTIDPSQQLGRLTLTLVDIFEILQAIDMQLSADVAPAFGDDPSAVPELAAVPALLEELSENIFFQADEADQRIRGVLDQAGFNAHTDYYVVFSLNVYVNHSVYSPGETVMTVIQEAADAEFPGVSNVYTDRFGRLCVHGRLAKFDPEGVEAGAGVGVWDFREFQAGDGEAVAAAAPGTMAQIRRFAYNRGLSKIINTAVATPDRRLRQAALTAGQLAGQLVQDNTSRGQWGHRSWSAMSLQTTAGLPPLNTTDLQETRHFAEYMVENYKQPHTRVTEIGFRSISLEHEAAEGTWNLLCRADVADTVTPVVHGPDGNTVFETGAAFFIEGIHEEARALSPDMDDVTMTLDLSPRSLYDGNPWA